MHPEDCVIERRKVGLIRLVYRRGGDGGRASAAGYFGAVRRRIRRRSSDDIARYFGVLGRVGGGWGRRLAEY